MGARLVPTAEEEQESIAAAGSALKFTPALVPLPAWRRVLEFLPIEFEVDEVRYIWKHVGLVLCIFGFAMGEVAFPNDRPDTFSPCNCL